MSELQPLSKDMIRTFLLKEGGDYDPDEEGFVYWYDYEEKCDCRLRVWLGIEGDDTYVICISNERTQFPDADFDRLVRLCNEWNGDVTYPVAYVSTDDEAPGQVTIELSYSVTAKGGLTQAQLNDATDEIVDAAFGFWEWAHAERGL